MNRQWKFNTMILWSCFCKTLYYEVALHVGSKFCLEQIMFGSNSIFGSSAHVSKTRILCFLDSLLPFPSEKRRSYYHLVKVKSSKSVLNTYIWRCAWGNAYVWYGLGKMESLIFGRSSAPPVLKWVGTNSTSCWYFGDMNLCNVHWAVDQLSCPSKSDPFSQTYIKICMCGVHFSFLFWFVCWSPKTFIGKYVYLLISLPLAWSGKTTREEYLTFTLQPRRWRISWSWSSQS